MNKKSAKDLAFDKERAKFRKKIKELEEKIKQKDIELSVMTNRALRAEGECESLKNWVDRLCEYTNLSRKDLEEIRRKDAEKLQAYENFNAFVDILRNNPFNVY